MKDIEIARTVALKPITTIAKNFGISPNAIEAYGKYKAKIPLSLKKKTSPPNSALILVTAISPTPAGEGKTTMSIGLSEGLNLLSKKTTVVLREPSLGPVFGIKGGATGGGWSQVVPMEDINLHFTGDFSAIEKAHNLLAAVIDNALQHAENPLDINPKSIRWKRVMDMNDRALRQIVIGLGGKNFGVPRETGFDITAASEIMAILCLATDLKDLKQRLGNIYVGQTHTKQPVFARDLKAAGAMALLLKDAIKPNLVQTLSGNPALIHGGPFANIAQGTNSVIATRMALEQAEYTVTEAGFGADLGAEKFLNIKCPSGGLAPKAVVLTTTLRALKYHGGAKLSGLETPDLEALEKGLPNLEKHLENISKFNLPAVIALNVFTTDTAGEIAYIRKFAARNSIPFAVAKVWEKGGKGALDLAQKVIDTVAANKGVFRPLYDWKQPVTEKIAIIAKEIYGANGVEYTPKALADLKTVEQLGFGEFPICMAKTQKSLSDDPKKLGRPKNFTITVREIEIAAGARFLIPITGTMMRMPGLPKIPASEAMDIDDQGVISGLF